MSPKPRILMTLAVVAGLAVLSVPTGVLASSADDPAPRLGKRLTAVQKATARYRDVRIAVRAGYRAVGSCVAEPGRGAMGTHYLHPGLAADGRIDAARPELLLYVPARGGGQELVGVEYFRADADQDLSTAGDRPTVLGQPFDGPMEGHEPGMPRHYDLHVWVHDRNPDGAYAQLNPRVRC